MGVALPARLPLCRVQCPSSRSLLKRLAASVLIGAALVFPARAYDLQYRQNGTSFTAVELRRIFNGALPAGYDQRFPDQRWTTYLLLDAHADQGLVAITLGLSPRLGPSQALLPVATFSVIEPLPRSTAQWQRVLAAIASRYSQLMLENSSRIIHQF
jgi:hypothetical protein